MKFIIAAFLLSSSGSLACNMISELIGSWNFVDGEVMYSADRQFERFKAKEADFEFQVNSNGQFSLGECRVTDETNMSLRCHTGEFQINNGQIYIERSKAENKVIGYCDARKLKFSISRAPFEWPGTVTGNHEWLITKGSDNLVTLEGKNFDHYDLTTVVYKVRFQRR